MLKKLFIIFIFNESVDEPVKEKTDTTEINKASDFKPEAEGRIIKNSKHIESLLLSMIFLLFLKNHQLKPLSKAQILLKLERLPILNLPKIILRKKVKNLKIANTLKGFYYPCFSCYF